MVETHAKRATNCQPLEEFMDRDQGDHADRQKVRSGYFRSKMLLNITECYLAPEDAGFAHLADGGMADNFALKGLTDWFVVHDDEALFERTPIEITPEAWQLPAEKWSLTPNQMVVVQNRVLRVRSFMHLVHMTRRALTVVIDGQREIDPVVARRDAGPTATEAVDSMISNGVDQGNVASFAELIVVTEGMSKHFAIRDLIVMERLADKASFEEFMNSLIVSEQELPTDGDSAEDRSKKLRDARRKIDDGHRRFDEEFRKYAAEIASLERSVHERERSGRASLANEQYAAALKALWARDEQHLRRWLLRWAGDWFGDISNGLNFEAVRKLIGPKDEKQLLEEYLILKKKLQLMKEWRSQVDGVRWRITNARPTADIVKVSIIDDCNSARRSMLLNSQTGLGIDKSEIAGAIQSGRDVAARHLERIREFVAHGKKVRLTDCVSWSARRPAQEAGETADDERH